MGERSSADALNRMPDQDPGSPVRPIPTDDDAPPKSGIALCLSGGGYRAMLFHLGALWRLNDCGYLRKLDRISSVSGGSIIAGALGLKWSQLAFNQQDIGVEFSNEVVPMIRALA